MSPRLVLTLSLCGLATFDAAEAAPVGVPLSSRATAAFFGEASGDEAGRAVTGAGDVNGDGRADLLVGSPNNDSSTGAVYLILGPTTGRHGLGEAHAKLVGEATQNIAGTSVGAAGDVDADGNDDIFVGAPSQSGVGSYSGAAYLVLGPVTGDVALEDADATLLGEAAYDTAGEVAKHTGDVDGDGHDDLLLTAPQHDGGTTDGGAAYVVLGPVTGDLSLRRADAKLRAEASWDVLQYASGAGDVDADGIDDILVGAVFNADHALAGGAAYLLCGPITASRSLARPDAEFFGGEGDWVTTLARAGDVNADGFDDVLIGSPYRDSRTDAGAVYLVLGPMSGGLRLTRADATLFGEKRNDATAESAGAGDLDADGHDDIVVGSQLNGRGGTSDGAAYVVFGPVSGTHNLSNADAKLIGATSDQAGADVDGAGDVDGDGLADLIVGVPYANDRRGGGTDLGAAYLVTGASL